MKTTEHQGVNPKTTIEELVLILKARKQLHNQIYLKGKDITDLINVQFCENLLQSLSLVGSELMIFTTADKEFRERQKRDVVSGQLYKMIKDFESETGKEVFADVSGRWNDDQTSFKHTARLKDYIIHDELDDSIAYYFDSVLELIDRMDIEKTGDFIVDSFLLITK